MSGTGATPSFPFPTNLGAKPREGSKFVSLIVNLNTVGNLPLLINLLSAFQTGNFSSVQSVIVDNTSNANTIVLKAIESGQVIRVSGYTMGRFPLITGPSPEFSLTQTGNPRASGNQSGTVGLFFLNTEGPLFETRIEPVPCLYSNVSLALTGNLPIVLPITQPGSLVAISSIDLTLWPFAAPGAAANGFIEIYEQSTGGLPGSGASFQLLWSTYWGAPAGSTDAFYSRQVTFPQPLVQTYPGNPIWMVSAGTAFNPNASLTLTYSLFPIA